MRVELIAAYAMGIALPVLETLRRRTNFGSISSYVDDFIAGALYAVALVSLVLSVRSATLEAQR